MLVRIVLGLSLVLVIGGTAVAHDLFIVPEQFRVSAGQTVTIGFHSGDGFPESVQNPARLRDASLHGAGGVTPIAELRTEGKRSIGSAALTRPGHYIATIVASANTITMEPGEFLDYLKEEGLTQVIDARTKSGDASKSARERYTKYAKSILLAGAPNDAYKQVVGMPIEFVPERDPYDLKPGAALPVRLMLRGAPARGIEIRASWADSTGSKTETIGKTDSNGHIDIPLKSAGSYRLHAIHMEKVSDPALMADWESLWATLTFEIK